MSPNTELQYSKVSSAARFCAAALGIRSQHDRSRRSTCIRLLLWNIHFIYTDSKKKVNSASCSETTRWCIDHSTVSKLEMADLEADLFGEESDEDNAEQGRRNRKSKVFEQPARRLGDDDEMESDEDEQPQRHQRPIGPPLVLNAELVDLPARDSIRLVRLSNILGLETQPYDPSTFQISQEYYTDEQGTRRIKLTNQLRWREIADDEGQPARQSNARFVQWEDGTWQLLLGDEVLDVKELDMQQDNSFLFVRHQGVIQVSQSICSLPSQLLRQTCICADYSAVATVTFIVNCLWFSQGQASLETKIALQPASLNSKLHTRLTAAVDKRHTKVHKVSTTPWELSGAFHSSFFARIKKRHDCWWCRFATLQLSVTLLNRRITRPRWKRTGYVVQLPFKRNRCVEKANIALSLLCADVDVSPTVSY